MLLSPRTSLAPPTPAGECKNAFPLRALYRHRKRSSLGSRNNCAADEAFADQRSPRTMTIGVASAACPSGEMLPQQFRQRNLFRSPASGDRTSPVGREDLTAPESRPPQARHRQYQAARPGLNCH